MEGQSLCLGHEGGALRVIERVSSDAYTWFSQAAVWAYLWDRDRHWNGTEFFLHSESDWS